VTEQEKKLFGQKLQILRKRKKLKQEYIAKKIGCSLRTWWRWERGLGYPLLVYRPKILEIFPELVKV